MILLGNLLIAIGVVLESLLWFLTILIFAAVFISWVNADPYNPLVRFVRQSTDPLFEFVARKIPLRFGSIDFTPILVILMIVFLNHFLVASLKNYGEYLKFPATRASTIIGTFPQSE